MIAKVKSKVVPISGKAQKRAERAGTRAGRATEEVERLPFDLSALEEEGDTSPKSWTQRMLGFRPPVAV